MWYSGVKHLQELAAANLGPPPAVNQIEVRAFPSSLALLPRFPPAEVVKTDIRLSEREQMHPWFQMHDVVTYCRKHGIAIQAYCPLSRGEYFEDEVLLRVCQEVSRCLSDRLM
jgi:diketogulonate reductase-like aldo/keto reductase